MKDVNDDTCHMDICQGKAFYDVISNYSTQSSKGQKDIYKLLFDKKHGVAYMKTLNILICCTQMKPRYLNVA